MAKEFDICSLKEKILEKLSQINPEKIYIFGSYAWGNPTSESDLDLCVVEKSYHSRWDEKKKIYDLLKEIEISKDILVPTKEEFDFYSRENGSVYKEIYDKGLLLWSSKSSL